MKDITPILQNTPMSLRARRQWVCWRQEADAKGNPTKMPSDAKTGRLASTADPATWTSFDQAYGVYAASGQYDGIGFVFSRDDPFCGIDVDDCLGPDGKLSELAQDIVSGFDTYTEISPSGRGLKLFLWGRKPDYAGSVANREDGRVEVYDHGRYFTVTGNVWPSSPSDVSDRQAALDILCDHLWGRKQTKTTPTTPAKPADGGQPRRRLSGRDVGDSATRQGHPARCGCSPPPADASSTILPTPRPSQRSGRMPRSGCPPFPTNWTDEQIARRVRDAERKCRRGSAVSPAETLVSGIGPNVQ